MPEKKSKSKDPYLSRNEFKKGFYDQPDKPPVTDETLYGTGSTKMKPMPYYPDEESAIEKLPYRPEDGPVISIPMSGRSPEEYKTFKETPYERKSYKEGGDIHIEKGESYIKDLIK